MEQVLLKDIFCDLNLKEYVEFWDWVVYVYVIGIFFMYLWQ